MHQKPSLNGAVTTSQPNNSMPFLPSIHPHNAFKTLILWTIHFQEKKCKKNRNTEEVREGSTWSPRAPGRLGTGSGRKGEGEPMKPPAHYPHLQKTPSRKTNPEHAHNHQECLLERKVDVELKKAGWREGWVRKRGDTRGEEQDGGMQAPLITCANRGTHNCNAAFLGDFVVF